MTASIPASTIVNILPNVLSAGGSALDLIGLVLTTSTRPPIGTVLSFTNPANVATYFGALATETQIANTYFGGYTGSTVKPAALLFSQYPSAAVSAYLRGGNVSSLTLSQLQALTGVLTISVGGTAQTSTTISLSAATSFSNAATIIAAGFTTPGFAVTYDTVSGGFIFTNTATGASSTISAASGSLATALKLTAATGAIVSPGADAATPGAAMDAVIAQTQNFVSFMTAWKPSLSDMLNFAVWTNAHADRYMYAHWDNDAAAGTSGDTTSSGSQITLAPYSGIAPTYAPNNGANAAAALMGTVASINFQATNGRITTAFKSAAVVADVTNSTIAANLNANGYNYYGAFATANQPFLFYYPGQISGKFDYIDSWVDQVWMNNAFQLALLELLTTVESIPYNADGDAQIEEALSGPIQDALNFGAIRSGVSLSPTQAVAVNTAAGRVIADVLEQRGWYIMVGVASPQVRAARGSPPVYVWWTDGQSIQNMTVASVLVQ